jgi:hypothetical protein
VLKTISILANVALLAASIVIVGVRIRGNSGEKIGLGQINVFPSTLLAFTLSALFLVYFLHASFRKTLKQEIVHFSSQKPDTTKIPREQSIAFLILFSVWAYLMFERNKQKLFVHFDGSVTEVFSRYYMDTFEIASLSTSMITGLSTGSQFPVNFNLDPGYVVASLVATENTYGQVCYLVWSLLLFVSTFFLAKSLGTSNFISVIAGWIITLLLLVPTSFGLTAIVHHIPHITTDISAANICVTLLCQLANRVKQSKKGIRRRLYFLTFMIVYIVLHHPFWVLVVIPWLLMVVIYVVISQKIVLVYLFSFKRHMFVCLAIVVYSLIHVYSLYSFSVPILLPNTFEIPNRSLKQISLLFSLNPTASLFILLSLVMVLMRNHLSKKVSCNLYFEKSVIAFTIVQILLGALILALPNLYSGPHPVYFELHVLSTHVVYLSIFLRAVFISVWNFWSREHV